MKSPAWQLSLILCTALFTLNAAAQGNGPFSTTGDIYEAYRQKGLEALKRHDTHEAISRFNDARQAAKDSKDRVRKREAKDLIRKTEKYYAPFFDQLERAKNQAARQKYKDAVAEYDRALTQARKLVDFSIEAAWVLDEQFYNRTLERRTEMDDKRVEAFREAQSSGMSSLSTDKPQQALSLFEYARSQMNEQEARRAEIDDWTRKAHYHIWLQEGDSHFRQQRYELALHFYEKAKSYSPRYDNELDRHISRAQEQLAGHYLTHADGLYRQGDYTLSAKAYRRSQQYDDNYQLGNRLSARYHQFLEEGERALQRGAYHEARNHFKKAWYFQETAEAGHYLREANRMINYLDFMEKGRALLWDNKVDEAYDSFQKAISENPTDEAARLIHQVEDYRRYLELGRAAIGNNMPEEAIAHFKKAQALICTPEASGLISMAAGLYTDVTVVLDANLRLKKDISHAVIYLKNLSQQGDYLHQRDYRSGKAYFYALKPGKYTIFIHGLKNKGSGGQRLSIEEEYNHQFTLDGGAIELLVSASGVKVQDRKLD